jgi:adenosylhomocysteine nucleosidase
VVSFTAAGPRGIAHERTSRITREAREILPQKRTRFQPRYNSRRVAAPKPLILVALQFEARALNTFVTRRQAVSPFTTRVLGPRATRLAGLQTESPAIILAGLSGALDPALRGGNVLIDDRSTFPTGPTSLPRCNFHTAASIVATPDQKRDLRNRTGADAVDMESDIVRAWAKEKNLPFLGIRAIADSAHETLDPALAHLVNQSGRSRPTAAARALLRQPALLPRLLHAHRVSSLALERLAEELINVLRHTYA